MDAYMINDVSYFKNISTVYDKKKIFDYTIKLSIRTLLSHVTTFRQAV